MTKDRIIILFAAVLFFTTYVKAQTDVHIVVQAGQLDIFNNPLCIVPTKGLYVAVDNSLISIDAEDDESEIGMNKPKSVIRIAFFRGSLHNYLITNILQIDFSNDRH